MDIDRTMKHEFKTIEDVKVVASGVLQLKFNCGSVREVDLTPVMHGALFEPLKDPSIFEQVKIDREVGTIYWPHGADFDPDTLFNWDAVVAGVEKGADL